MGRSAILAPPAPMPAAAWPQWAVRWALRCAGAALALFHAGLLVERLSDASIAEPGVGLRWGIAALVGGLALLFRRRGLPLARGRSGLVFWLLVLLLHVGAAPAPAAVLGPEELLLALPAGAALALAVGCGVAMALGASPRRERTHAKGATSPQRRRQVPPLARRFAPRPPPVA